MATATLNTNITSIATPQAAVGSVISHAAIWDDTSQTNFITAFALSAATSALELGQTLNIAANAWVFTLTSTQLSNFGEQEALRGIFRANRYITWHTADPGTSGTTARETNITPTTINVTNITYG